MFEEVFLRHVCELTASAKFVNQELMSINEIYHTYKNLVYNLALNYVQNVEDAEEITQDVFLSVHDSLENFRQDSKMSTWIYRITINKSLDFIKSRNRKKRFAKLISIFKSDGSPIHFETADIDHPGAILEHKEELDRIFMAMNQLPANQKTVLVLAKIEQKSQNEIAEIMNVSVKAVESLMQRAKTNLAERINRTEGIN